MKILMLETRQLSYNSSAVFMKVIEDIFKKMGADVIHLIVSNPEADSDLLESFIGRSFDAVIDINSLLPLAECDYGHYLDCIDAPFINFIVDHPMHVHEYLNVKLKRYYVVCLDRYHKEYIIKYYPHIKGVKVICLGGISCMEESIDFMKRKYHILFPATYTPPKYYLSVIREMGVKLEKIAKDILSELINGSSQRKNHDLDSKVSIHDLYRKYEEIPDKKFAKKMYAARYIDRYIRDYLRDMVLDRFLSEGYKINVIGARWEMYDGKYKDNLIIHSQCNYLEMLKIIGNSQLVLNVQPLFLEAAHDRIFNSMVNGAVPITDTCEYIEENYADEVIIYDKINIQESVAALCRTINDTERLAAMSEKLKEKSAKKETWEVRLKRLHSFIQEIN